MNTELKDFVIAGCQVKLNWRGTKNPFWMITSPNEGPFRPAVELDLDQARAVKSAVEEFDRRVADLAAGDLHPNQQSTETVAVPWRRP